MKKVILDEAERDILESYERGEWVPVIAAQEGIPYQTLVSSIIHKYVSGYLIEKKTA